MISSAVQRVLGLLLAVFSITMLPPMLVSWLYADGTWRAFGLSFLIVLVSGLAIWAPVRTSAGDMRLGDGFMIVALFWVVLGLFGAVPLLLVEQPAMSLTDAVFESIAG